MKNKPLLLTLIFGSISILLTIFFDCLNAFIKLIFTFNQKHR